MINNVSQTQQNYSLVKNYGKLPEEQIQKKREAFAESLSNQASKTTTQNNVAQTAPTKISNDDQTLDAVYSISNTAKVIKEITKGINLENTTFEEVKTLAENMYKAEIIEPKDYSSLISGINIMQENSSVKQEQDIIKRWENKLELLKENNSPSTLIKRTKSVLRILKNVNALNLKPENLEEIEES